ncbi:MAG: acyl carrier protein [Albidovulum sp.]|nr:acyl carrier protein [Albidovulum sp.]
MATKDRLKQLIDEHLNLGRAPDFGAQLSESGVSSLDAVAFFKEVKSEFSLTLAPEDCLQFKTLGEVVEFIDARRS